ncbi:MAG: LytR/AlgR family response regulator transcription factor, partial [Mangrovibacterium sp.]
RVPVNSPVIFCTAYDEYALRAFKANGIDYILKPFTKKNIQEALEKYASFKDSFTRDAPSYKAILELLNDKRTQKQASILVYRKDHIIPVKTDDIALFFMQEEVIRLLTFNQQNFSVNKTLEELEKITGDDFYRANRQFLINKKAIKNISQYFARKLSVNLTVPFQEKIIVSKERSKDFLSWLSGR